MVIVENKKLTEYDPKTLQKLKDLELKILKEFIRICDENDLEYYLMYGTLIGAIRHKGFIPWDDDIDVAMLREEYDKFVEVMKDYKSDTFEFLSPQTHDLYRPMYSILSLKGTNVERIYDRNTDFNIGICIEIFVLENAPKSYLKQKLYRIRVPLFQKFLLSFGLTYNDIYPSETKQKIGRTIRKIYKILKINNEFMKKRTSKIVNYGEKDSNYVCDIGNDDDMIIYDKSIFKPAKKTKFEDIEAKIPNDYDTCLKLIYGEYMKIPPKEEQINHEYDDVDFGKYN